MEAVSASLRRARLLLGTFVEIEAADAARSGMSAHWEAALEAALEAAFAAVAAVHRLMSFHDPDSDVARINRDAASGAVDVHDWTCQVLELALDLNRQSAGIFDIAVAPAMQDLGLLPRSGNERRSASIHPGTGAAIQLLPGRQVRFRHAGMAIDLGGIAKGFAVDRAIEALRRHGVTEGLVNAGGDLAAFGPRRRTVHMRDPRQPGRLMGEVELGDAALATSGGRFDPLLDANALGCAVIDPATGTAVRAILGATVCAPCCIIADALTKIVMNAGERAAPLLKCYGASALFVTAGGDVHVTADWKDAVRLAA